MATAKSIESIRFGYQLGWASDYGHLLSGELSGASSEDQLLDVAMNRRRVLISAKGGSGKSTIARRLAADAESRGLYVALLNMKRWSTHIQTTWEKLTQDALVQADFLLRVLAEPETSLAEIDLEKPDRRKLVILDGLNEIRLGDGQKAIKAVEKLSTTFLKLSVVVMDRLVRRDLDDTHWAVATVLPLETEVIRDAVRRTLGESSSKDLTRHQLLLMKSPFFLDKTLKDGRLTDSTSEAVLSYVRSGSGIDEVQLAAAARAAFIIYVSGKGGRSFVKEIFATIAGAEIYAALTHSGILIEAETDAHFEHHLFHDVLAAYHLARNRQLWSNPSFDGVSMNASSFDSIARTLEQVASSEADQLIRAIYDWNPYAAAYAISETWSSDDFPVSKEMLVVIAAMLAERRWDLIEGTVQRSTDALNLLGTQLAQRFARASTFEEVTETVAGIESDQAWFERWKSLFTRSRGSESQDSDLDSLIADDPIEGWTAANVLKRSKMAARHIEKVIKIADESECSSHRWRAVHVLGVLPEGLSVEVLLKRLRTDESEWVRYGSIRSLMELAARYPKFREPIFEALLRNIGELLNRERLLEEFSRGVLSRVEGDTDTWMGGVGRILELLLSKSTTKLEVDRWVRLGQELETRMAA
jgi:hypothetical protein